MTYIINTTNLSESFMREIVSVVKPNNIPPVASIKLRNKMEDTINGNWGKYYTRENKITLCVPQFIKVYHTKLLYTHYDITLMNRYEFFAAVCAHEYRHAWQWIHHNNWYENKLKIEVDAEEYELTMLQVWRDYVDENQIEYPKESNIQVAQNIKYRDFK